MVRSGIDSAYSQPDQKKKKDSFVTNFFNRRVFADSFKIHVYCGYPHICEYLKYIYIYIFKFF